jgi:surface antigen
MHPPIALRRLVLTIATLVTMTLTTGIIATTAAHATDLPGVPGTVRASLPLNIRSGPGTGYDPIGTARTEPGYYRVLCYADGDEETGWGGTNRHWDRIAAGDPSQILGYVSDVWLDTGGDVTKQVAPCVQAPPTHPIHPLSQPVHPLTAGSPSKGRAADDTGSPQPDRYTVDGSNDYPWDGFATDPVNGEKRRIDRATGRTGDEWGMGYGQCVSFVAWKIYENNGGTERPSGRPASGWFPSDGLAKSPVTSDWGNAGNWNVTAAAKYRVDHVPHVGSVAQWVAADPENLQADPHAANDGQFPVGHVAYVTKVYPDRSIDIAQYNLRDDTGYSTLHLTPNEGGTDTQADHPADAADPYHTSTFTDWHVTWPDNFIHVNDGT